MKILRRLLPQNNAVPDCSDARVIAHLPPSERRIIDRVRAYTMTSEERIVGLIDAVRHCQQRALPGAFAECGVWRGGSVLTMILTLQELGVSNRDIYLYDTFEGMTAPGTEDVSDYDPPALATWDGARQAGKQAWDFLFRAEVFNEQQVRELLLATGYPAQHLHFVKGPVEQTLPGTMADALCLLRLDTDWYESTLHELVHLYPRLVQNGVLIVDDYGHWRGCRQAVDEYFSAAGRQLPFLQRVDYTCRMAIKV